MESSHETLGRAQRRVEFDLPKRNLCPCGEESLDAWGGLHVIGAKCRERVAKHTRYHFGRLRLAGRLGTGVEDLIQDCYGKLLGPGGLDSFQPPIGREQGDAFRAWLSAVVRHHCINRRDLIHARPEEGGDTLDRVPESRHAITSEQVFARRRILEIIELAAAAVEPAWRAMGPKRSERFEVIALLLVEKVDAKTARERLRMNDGLLKKLKSELKSELLPEVRKQVLDDLFLPPGLDPEAIELRIDQEIAELFQAAYPGSSIALPSNDTEADAESKDEQPESKR